MAKIVLFHSVLGLRPSVLADAERLRQAGHEVHAPDLYGGVVFDDMDDAFRYFQNVGVVEMLDRTQAAADELPSELVYAGYSNGGASAEFLAGSRPGARAAVLIHAALPLSAFDLAAWPADVPVQVHYGDDDPWREQKAIDMLAASVGDSGSSFEQYDYPGAGHLFADPDFIDYHAVSTELMWERVLAFLGRVDAAS